jgi:hypothetical protein
MFGLSEFTASEVREAVIKYSRKKNASYPDDPYSQSEFGPYLTSGEGLSRLFHTYHVLDRTFMDPKKRRDSKSAYRVRKDVVYPTSL